jgi:hypothetical protein
MPPLLNLSEEELIIIENLKKIIMSTVDEELNDNVYNMEDIEFTWDVGENGPDSPMLIAELCRFLYRGYMLEPNPDKVNSVIAKRKE